MLIRMAQKFKMQKTSEDVDTSYLAKNVNDNLVFFSHVIIESDMKGKRRRRNFYFLITKLLLRESLENVKIAYGVPKT